MSKLTSLKHYGYICKNAATAKEATELVESSFEYVTEMQDIKLHQEKQSMSKRRFVVPRAGFEPATTRSSASPSKAKVFESSALPG